MTTSIPKIKRRGFSLMEVVIAIGVLAILLSAFLAIFAPAAEGIRRSISAQAADRLAYALEEELVNLRDDGDVYSSGFDKAFQWILGSNQADNLLIVYQYRGDPDSLRSDGTMEPFTGRGVSGIDFIIQPMIRQRSDAALEEDFEALEGRVFVARLTQLVHGSSGELEKGSGDQIVSAGGGAASDSASYSDAMIAFAADFYRVRNSSYGYVANQLELEDLRNPVFTRNLAVRR